MAAKVGIDAVIGPRISEGDELVTDGAVKTVVAHETGPDAA